MPTAVESYTRIGAVVVQLPQTPQSPALVVTTGDNGHIGGRSGTVGLPAQSTTGHNSHLPVAHNFLPAVQAQNTLTVLLRSELGGIASAIQSTLPQSHGTIDVLGIGTDAHTLEVLIGLLKTQGFHATICFCDGSVRPGFTGATAVIRRHGGGVVVGQFLNLLAQARQGA